jgi:uncharacterized protein YjiS (DUF1127 family)
MEQAMTITFTTQMTPRMFRWSQVKNRFADWQRRSRSRHELQSLSDATLRDIGISRCDAHREFDKPFWMT